MSRYIVLEGPDGAGKTTLHKALKKKVDDSFLFIKEPYHKEYINQLKVSTHPLDRCAIFLQDRIKLMNEVIIPALKEGKTVVSDRSYISCEIYQTIQMKEYYDALSIPPVTEEKLMRLLVSLRPLEMPPISHIICLIAPVDEIISRISRRKGEKDRVDVDYLNVLRSMYVSHIVDQPCCHTIIDTSKISKQELVEQAYDILVPPFS